MYTKATYDGGQRALERITNVRITRRWLDITDIARGGGGGINAWKEIR